MAMRVTFGLSERAEDDTVELHSTYLSVDAVGDTPTPTVRVTFELAERLEDTPIPTVRVTGILSEYITDLVEWETIDLSELIMSPDPYPDLIGLTFPVGQKPTFSTNVQTHTSGRTTRTSYYQNPIWEFTLSYEYLPNRSGKDADYKTIMGFFLARKGSFETFLFYNKDDQYVVDGLIGTGNGDQVSWPFAKEWGSWIEPVGYVDTATSYHVYVRDAETFVIGGSHSVTVSHGIIELYSVKVDGVIFTPTASTSPAAGEYHQAGSVFTFNPASDGHTAVIDYKYEALLTTDYIVGAPATLSFTSAPNPGAIITATFRYAYICTFKNDEADFDQFMDKLYEFDQVELRSVPA